MDLQEASDDSIVAAGASTSSLALVEAAKERVEMVIHSMIQPVI